MVKRIKSNTVISDRKYGYLKCCFFDHKLRHSGIIPKSYHILSKWWTTSRELNIFRSKFNYVFLTPIPLDPIERNFDPTDECACNRIWRVASFLYSRFRPCIFKLENMDDWTKKSIYSIEVVVHMFKITMMKFSSKNSQRRRTS